MRRLPQGTSSLLHADPGHGRRVKVMVVDDNAGFRETLLALLDTEDLLVVGEAESGPEAIELAERIEPDVVLMDVRMPTMDGIEATRRLKELLPGIGVVALTGHEDQDIVRGMLVAGASGYVLKDSDGDDIIRAVMQAALGGAMLSPGVTPGVIGELTEALERERRRLRDLEEAHAALMERSTRRHELLARVGHELRTPVTVILGMAQTLAKGIGEPAQRAELLDRLVARAQDMARLLERLELTVEAAITEQVNLRALALRVANERECVSVLSASHLPDARLNPVAARRVLEELVDNAVRFSPEGSGVEIRIELTNEAIEVRVIDRGNGIPEGERERVFNALEQLEDLNVRTHQGAGIGLSIARSAARAMEGDVVVESSGPAGSTFLWTVSLESRATATNERATGPVS